MKQVLVSVSRATLFGRKTELMPRYLAVAFQKSFPVKLLVIDIKAG